jgi:RNA polymerase sigma-70 factor (ECF subfamily)
MNHEELETTALRHLDALYRFAIELAPHPDEASDLVQETYLRALDGSCHFDGGREAVRPWLFETLHRTYRRAVARGRLERAPIDDLDVADPREPGADQPRPAGSLASLDWEQVDERLKAAIDRLQPVYRTVLLLWGVEGLKYREIAEVLDVPIGTVMSRLKRARRILTQQLQETYEEERQQLA